MKAWHHIAALLALTGAAVGGCSTSGNEGLAASGDFGATPTNASTPGSGDNTGAGSVAGFAAADAGVAALPAEMKDESEYQSPVATGNVVWIANPTSGRVAYIDAASFVVQTIQTGNAPTYVAAVPDMADMADDVAIVLDPVSQDATLLRRDAQGDITTTTFPSTADANSWAVSASGQWAIAWTNSAQVSSPDPTQGFQAIAVMDLSTAAANGAGTTTFLNVGFRPSQIAFEGDSEAFAVTQDGITAIDLSGAAPVVTTNFPLSAASVDDVAVSDAGVDGAADDAGAIAPEGGAGLEAGPGDAGAPPDAGTPGGDGGGSSDDASASSGAPDVSFSFTSGAYALVRQDGAAAITIVSLSDGTLTTVPLPSAPTDLTLSPHGDYALAVLRDTSTVARLPIPGIVADPTAVAMIPVPGQTIGRAIVTPDNLSALLFTTVDPSVMALTVLTFPQSIHTIALHAPVLAVFPTGDSKNAVVLHDVTPSPGSNVQGAYSLVPLAGDLPVLIQSTTAPPTAVAIAPQSDRVVVSLRDDTTSTYALDLALLPSQEIIEQTLASPPIAVGIAAGAERGYAAQDYPEGRITFVDLYAGDGGAAGAARTITGFDLGARIVEGSNP